MVEWRGKFKIEIFLEDLLFVVTGAGEINFNETVDAISFIANHPDFNPEFRLIVDLRLIYYHPSYKDLQGIIATMKFLKDKFKNKVALVTDPKIEVVAKLFAIYNKQAGIKIKSFTSREKADLWIS